MEYVNTIAHIVHTAVATRGGAANKNIGDAFLLVWKMPKGLRSRDINLMSLTGGMLSSNGGSRRPSMAASRPAGSLSLSSGMSDMHTRYSEKEAVEREENGEGGRVGKGEVEESTGARAGATAGHAGGHSEAENNGAGDSEDPVQGTRSAASLSSALMGPVSYNCFDSCMQERAAASHMQ